MSFRRTRNTQDQWLSYCQSQQGLVRAIGLPAELFRRAEVFEEFLRTGIFREKAESELFLSNLPDPAFLALEQFTNGFFDFQHAYPALQQERLNRFQRYG